MASAADLGPRVVYKAPPLPPPVQDWSGVYVGVEGGYGWGTQNFNPAFDPFFNSDPSIFLPGPSAVHPIGPPFAIFDPTISSVNQSGGLAGVFAGVQKQWGSVVLGAEISADWADINGSTTATNSQTCHGCFITIPPGAVPVVGGNININQSQTINSKIDELGFAGPKAGWAFGPNWMIYGTGGLAWAHVKEDASQTQAVTCTNAACAAALDATFDFSQTQSGGLTMFGWAAGGGIDYKWQIDPGSAVVFGVKYLHYGFGNNTLVLADNINGSGFSNAIDTKEHVDVVTGRISYLFSIH
jgi:outer membrane immunogenic protein